MRLFSAVLFLFAFLMFFANAGNIPDYGFFYQIVMFSPCLMLLFFAIRGVRTFYSFYLFLIFYTLGYPIYLVAMYLTRDKYTTGGWMGIGNFVFSADQLNELSVFGSLLMAGLYLGIRWYNRGKATREDTTQSLHVQTNINRLNYYILLWFSSSLVLIFFMSAFGLGRTGLQDSNLLPLGLKGFLLYARYVLVPLFGLFLLGKAVASRQYKLTKRLVLLLFFIAIVVAISALSRSDIVLLLGTLLFFLVTHYDYKIVRFGRRLVLSAVLLVVLGTQLVQLSRNVEYSGNRSTAIDLGDLVTEMSSLDINAVIDNLVVLLTVRQGGARDMAVAMNSSYQSIDYIWNFFWQINEKDFMIDVWGFRPEEFDVEGKSFGTGFNGFGWYAFGRNPVVLFGLAVLTGLFVGWVEYLFVRTRSKPAQLFIAFNLALSLWNSLVWSRAWKLIFMVLLGSYLITLADRRLRVIGPNPATESKLNPPKP